MNILKRQFRYSVFNVVYWLIGINVLIFAATRISGPEVRLRMTFYLSMYPPAVLNGWIWSFVTYMFMHADFGHVFFNMFGLFIFGIHVERQMGSKEFLLYYLVTGALAGVFSFAVYYFTGNLRVFLMGASGALYAVQLAFAVYNPHAIIRLWGIIPMRAPVMVLGFTVLSIFFVVTGGGGNVAHLTHLAGFGFGWIYFLVRLGINPWRQLTGR